VSRAVAVLRRTNALGWLLIVLLALLLQVCVRAFELEDSVAAPSDTVRALVDGLRDGTLSGEIATTLSRWAQSLALAIALGVSVGVLLGSSRWLEGASSVVVEFMRPIPAVALIPLVFLAFGSGTPTIRFVAAYAAVWPILINTVYGVRGVDHMLLDVARTSGSSGAGTLLRVRLPAALPSVATGIKVSAPIALVVVITAEWLAGTDGIGAYIDTQRSALEVPAVYAAVVLVALLGYLLNIALAAAQRRALFWVGEERAAR
jgi:ABC-type nitrate/sulfonate/bicarbonate transport system permease component